MHYLTPVLGEDHAETDQSQVIGLMLQAPVRDRQGCTLMARVRNLQIQSIYRLRAKVGKYLAKSVYSLDSLYLRDCGQASSREQGGRLVQNRYG